MANTGNRGIFFKKVPGDAQQIFVLANVLRCSTATEEDAEVLRRIDVFERVFDLASALDMAKNEDNLIDLGRLVYVNAPIVKVGQ